MCAFNLYNCVLSKATEVSTQDAFYGHAVSFCNPDIFRHVVLFCITGPGYSKVTASLVNVSLKFQTLISNIC